MAPVEAGSSAALTNVGLAGLTGMAGPPGGDRNAGATVTGARVPVRIGLPVSDGDDRPPSDAPRTVVTGVAARIREITRLRDEGDLTDEEYTELKKLLLGR